MKYVCIMGNNYSKDVNNKLIQLGYSDNSVWSTRKTENTEVLSEERYDKAVDENKMIHLETKNDIKYGILKPIGSRKYTTCVSLEQFDKIKSIYKEQVVGFYISDSLDDAKLIKNNSCNIMLCNNMYDVNKVVADILRLTKN